jgi:hypothetical protein
MMSGVSAELFELILIRIVENSAPLFSFYGPFSY